MIIDIPNIVLTPPRDLTYGFHEFELSNLEHLSVQLVSQEILIRQLRSNKSSLLLSTNNYKAGSHLESYIVYGLSDNNLVDYEKYTDLLYKLVGRGD